MTTYYSEGLRRRQVLGRGLGLLLTTFAVGSVGIGLATRDGADAAPAGEGTAGGGPADGEPDGLTTPNGWPVLTSEATGVVTVAGRDLRLRTGPARLVLVDFVRRFDARVEQIDRGELDDWGYARRAVRGSSTPVWSEHAAGTAVDLNATSHPQGVRQTFAATREKALRRLLDDFDGLVGWGGDFDTPDEMHFEIAVGPRDQALSRRAARLA